MMWSSVKEFISDLYVCLLWLAGAALTTDEINELHNTGGDRITYWMRRSKERLGNWWWLAVVFTVIVANFKLYTAIRQRAWGWVIFTALLDLAFIWTIPHVLGVW